MAPGIATVESKHQACILSREGESLGRVYGPDHYAGAYRTAHGLVNDRNAGCSLGPVVLVFFGDAW